MKIFSCACGNAVYFENSRCESCGRALGYLPEPGAMSAIEPDGEAYRALFDQARYRQCDNYRAYQVCNWMVPEDDSNPLCRACRLNRLIPDLSVPDNIILWGRLELAKRRLLYLLLALKLPWVGRDQDPEQGLCFDFIADAAGPDEEAARILTGHADGLITINVREADPGAREQTREAMGERYRTLHGHFRHEIGHYYWDRLVRPRRVKRFRLLFGDERQDYAAALDRHYANGPNTDLEFECISPYATAHPWEDWAETWAHYLHMTDTLETAHSWRFSVGGRRILAPPPLKAEGRAGFARMIADWQSLTPAMNAFNRSMGLPDAYPFVLKPRVINKLRFVHLVIAASVNAQP